MSFKITDFYPLQSRPVASEVFQDLVGRDLTVLEEKGKNRHIPQIVTFAEKRALREIKDNRDLIIRKAYCCS